jgi:hypothetical protein
MLFTERNRYFYVLIWNIAGSSTRDRNCLCLSIRSAALHSWKDIKFLSLVEDPPVFHINVWKNLLILLDSPIFLVRFVLRNLYFFMYRFIDHCLSFCPFSFRHYIVWPSSFRHYIVWPSSFRHYIVWPSSNNLFGTFNFSYSLILSAHRRSI